jgi:hypothetical protein
MLLSGSRIRAGLPYEMFDDAYSDAEARRARRMESIYHVGQDRAWLGRDVLASLVAKHGKPALAPRERRALARIFSIIMWGELAAWKISAQLADAIIPLEGKMAATSQAHDEARHFYVMHDYLEALGEKAQPLDRWARRVVEMTLGTPSLPKKLLGMQLTIETIALTIFQQVREMNVEPVLSELLPYYERDEARHVGLGVQLLPQLIAKMSLAERVDLALFQLNLLFSTLASLKAMEPDLESIGVDPRSILAIGFRKQKEVDDTIRAEFPLWPEDPPVRRIFEGLCELLFPTEESEGGPPKRRSGAISTSARVANAVQVLRRLRPSLQEAYAAKHGRQAA